MRFLPKPGSVGLTFCPTPYTGANVQLDLWTEGLELFHCWACHQFEIGKIYGDFQLAEAMDVHRCIADTWVASLVALGLATSHMVPLVPRNPESDEVFAFALQPPKVPRAVNIDWGGLQDFDPWMDRSLDMEVPDARFPDMFVDKYYHATVNEYFAIMRKTRTRPNNRAFEPIRISDHPRYAAKVPSQEHHHNKPPPIEWRRLIDELASA